MGGVRVRFPERGLRACSPWLHGPQREYSDLARPHGPNMTPNVPVGVVLSVVSGFLQGAVLLPMKFARSWKWENTWLVFAACAYFILPWVFAALTIPSLDRVYAEAQLGATLMVA